MEETLELRPEVRRFAEAMEQQLRENEHKGGWEHINMLTLVGRAFEELGEFVALMNGTYENGIDEQAFWDEAADTANFLMMICTQIQPLVEYIGESKDADTSVHQ